ncbi:MAG: SGNH/GDSL hydrolase family protein [Bryobacteraceae bacterium]|jgi:hypothetical protein
MKPRRAVLYSVLSLAVASISACAQVNAAAPGQELRVLFIGNSYTWFNNLPHLVTVLAESAHEARALRTTMLVGPGFTLRRHWEDGAAVAAIQRGSWDYVVLQEQSMLGSTAPTANGVPRIDPRLFHDYSRRFDAAIQRAGARTIFLLTWAHRDFPELQSVLNKAYLSIAKELGDRVAPVGPAWKEAMNDRPGLDLHQADQSHPTPAGSYLAACVLYATLYGKSPEGLTAQIEPDATGITDPRLLEAPLGGPFPLRGVNLGKSDARALQRIAWRVVKKAAK